jgi:F-type H+-transporting ATPase subunit a
VEISPDTTIFWSWGPINLNATIVFTWLLMALLVVASWLVTRNLTSWFPLSRGQNILEVLVQALRDQIRDVSQQDPDPFLAYVGTLFIFIAASNVLSVVPGFQPPTGSLSTTAALAITVFVAVPLYGIRRQGLDYFREYLKPTPVMLPLNILSDVSRTLALAVRLFGNVMSSNMIVAILLSIVPLFFPLVMQALGLLTGVIQAYIFAVMSMVFIAAATRVSQRGDEKEEGT